MYERYDPDLLRALDRLDLPAAPLSAEEADRVLAGAEARLPGARPAPPSRRGRLLRWLGRAGIGAAACAVLCCGVNTVNPALAEGPAHQRQAFGQGQPQRQRADAQRTAGPVRRAAGRPGHRRKFRRLPHDLVPGVF